MMVVKLTEPLIHQVPYSSNLLNKANIHLWLVYYIHIKVWENLKQIVVC